MNNNYFQNHISKLKLEAIVKSALMGLAIGFVANFATALVAWFLPIRGLWISLGIFLVASVGSGLFFYFKKFYPTNVRNARRIDSLGLYERLITMVEYENDTSVMARIQREDAKRALASVDKKQIRINISRAVMVVAIVFTVLGTSMTTVNALSDYGVMPDGNEILNNMINDATRVYYSVDYIAEKGGTIDGDDSQLVENGTNTEAVTAVADDGYMFVRWSDGVTEPTRYETDVKEDAVYYAEFMELDENPDGENDFDSGDADPNAPHRTSYGEDGKPEPGNGTPQEAPEGGGLYEPNNQIIDGDTFYRTDLDIYRDEAEDRLSDKKLTDGNSELTQEEIDLIKKYLEIV